MSNARNRLLALVRALSYEKREVVLASGRTSDFYIDGRATTLHPEGAALVGEVFLDAIERSGAPVEAVGGPTLGADPIATAVAIESFRRGRPIPAFLIRKEPKGHGVGRYLAGARNLRPGMRAALVEDTVTTGGSAIRAARHAEEEGLVIELFVVLCDRQEGGREAVEAAGYRFLPIFTRADLEDG